MKTELIVIHDGQLWQNENARLFLFGDEKVMIPESQIGWEDREANELLLPEWLIYEKGLEAYLK